MNFYFRDEVLPYYGGGTSDARRLAANDFMYWEVMRRACERGYRLFDFGRSKHRHRRLRLQEQLGLRADAARLSVRLAPGRTFPTSTRSTRNSRCSSSLEKAAAGRGGAARAADRARARLSALSRYEGPAVSCAPDPLSARQGRQDPGLEHAAAPRRAIPGPSRDLYRRARGHGRRSRVWRAICASVVWRRCRRAAPGCAALPAC